MKEPFAQVKSPIFIRLIVTFFAVIVPLYVSGFYIYRWSVDAVKSEIYHTAKSQVNFYLGNLEKDIERIKSLQLDLMLDDDLNQLAVLPESLEEAEKIKALRRLQKRLISIKDSNAAIENVVVYIPEIKKTISSAHGISDLANEQMNALSKITKGSKPLLNVLEHEIYLVTDKINKSGEFSFLTEITLTDERLKNQLTLLDTSSESGLVLTDDAARMYVTTSEAAGMSQTIKTYIIQQLTTQSEGDYEQTIKDSDYIFIRSKSDMLGLSLYKFIPEHIIFEKLDRFKLWLWLFTASAIALILLFSLTTFRMIKQPLGKLVKAFRKVEEGDLQIQIEHRHHDEFRLLYARFNMMVNRLKQMMEQVYMQKILAQRSELKLLQSQINPHFLYNSFYILYNMVELEDTDNAKTFTKQLGDYLQFVTRNTFDEVELAKEVTHARNYAEIQARRFRKRIRLEFAELPDVFGHLAVPRLILQPLIENTFEHGLANKMERGVVRISFETSGFKLVIVIEDNGDELTDDRLEEMRKMLASVGDEIEMTGIVNIHRRLQYKYGPGCGLELSRGKLGGLSVSVMMDTEGK